MKLELGLIISQILAFLIMLWILKRYAWRPLLAVMEERKQRIQAEFDAVEEQKKEIRRLTDMYEEKLRGIEDEAKVRMDQAAESGRNMARQIQEEARQQAKEILIKAQADIALELDKAKASLKRDVVEMVIGATEKMITEKLDPEKHEKLIMDFVDKLK